MESHVADYLSLIEDVKYGKSLVMYKIASTTASKGQSRNKIGCTQVTCKSHSKMIFINVNWIFVLSPNPSIQRNVAAQCANSMQRFSR